MGPTIGMGIFKFHLLLLFLIYVSISVSASKKSYIVYLGEHSHGPEPTSKDFDRVESNHHEFLGSFLGGKEKAKEAMIYSHTKHINAFSAMLDPKEAEEISRHEDVISIFEGKTSEFHTTKSWDFLGLEVQGITHDNSIWKKANFGEDVIIGSIDTGVRPDSEMFKDDGMGPIPLKWKGHCNNGDSYNDESFCNKKLISMRKFHKRQEQIAGLRNTTFSATDFKGHGTHTLSTAGGRFVPGVNVFGYNKSSVKGGAPNARLASYKVAFAELENSETGSGFDEDVIAAFDEAISNGVDVLTVSLGVHGGYIDNSHAIGSLHAVRNGVVVVSSAGNDGPNNKPIQNVWPWVITVGAGTTDRTFSTYVELGNKQRVKGVTLWNSTLPGNKAYPLISYRAATDNRKYVCDDEVYVWTKEADVKGKIVVAEVLDATRCSEALRDYGAVGMIAFDQKEELPAEPQVLSVARISKSDAEIIYSYMNSTTNPVGYIAPMTVEFNSKPAPMVASFSSRGPNPLTPEILKPDVIAPGVEILAAYKNIDLDASFASRAPQVPRGYNLLSGTSMSTSHVAGIVGLLKAVHPDWSPAMIKSALMTTANLLDNTNEAIKDYNKQPATPFAMGAGYVQPNNAVDPGLVYDLGNADYLNFLCASGVSNENITKINSNMPHKCRQSYKLLNFNYPSITVPKLQGRVTVLRKVTNVGRPGTYEVSVVEPPGISVTIKPKRLVFVKVGERKKFKINLKTKLVGNLKGYVFGKLVWQDGVHNVSSPIVVNSV